MAPFAWKFLPDGGDPDSGFMIMGQNWRYPPKMTHDHGRCPSAYPAGYQRRRRGNLGHSTCADKPVMGSLPLLRPPAGIRRASWVLPGAACAPPRTDECD